LSVMGSTYYLLNPKPEIFLASWLILSVLWYIGIVVSIYFILKSTRLGSMTSGIIGWATLAFWSTDAVYAMLGHPFLYTSLDLLTTIRDFISIATAVMVVVASHNMFHKIRVHGL
jgi:hypothetical protein